jgi:hypothetical protein
MKVTLHIPTIFEISIVQVNAYLLDHGWWAEPPLKDNTNIVIWKHQSKPTIIMPISEKLVDSEPMLLHVIKSLSQCNNKKIKTLAEEIQIL